jgi:Transmembrane amino acid transporter protein
VQVGLAAVYTVTGAKSMHVIQELSIGNEGADLTKYVFIFGVVQLALSQIPDFAHLWWVSIIGAAMSLGYSLLSGALAIAAARSDNASADYGRRGGGAAFWRGVFTSLGAIAFAYGGHSVLLEIQATLRVPPSAKASMMKGAPSARSGLAAFGRGRSREYAPGLSSLWAQVVQASFPYTEWARSWTCAIASSSMWTVLPAGLAKTRTSCRKRRCLRMQACMLRPLSPAPATSSSPSAAMQATATPSTRTCCSRNPAWARAG